MTEKEFKEFIEEQKASGKSEEDILKIFCFMFREGKLTREQLEAVVEALGYEMSEELRSLSDEELKEKILVKTDEGDSEGETVDPEGGEPPAAEPEEEESESEEEEESSSEEEGSGESEEEESEEDEKSKAMKLYGLK